MSKLLPIILLGTAVLIALVLTAIMWRWDIPIIILLLAALWARYTLQIIPAGRVALRIIAGHIHGMVESGLRNKMIPVWGKFFQYPLANQDVNIGEVEVVTAAGYFDPKIPFDERLPDNGQPNWNDEEELKQRYGDEWKKRREECRWEKATLKVVVDINFTWPTEEESLIKAFLVAPPPILPDDPPEIQAEKLETLKKFLREPFYDAIQDVMASRVWMQLIRDVNWLQQEIVRRMVTQANNPICKAGLLDDPKGLRVSITIELPEDLKQALPKVQAAKYEADVVKTQADAQRYRLEEEGKGKAAEREVVLAAQAKYPDMAALEALGETKGTHIGVTNPLLEVVRELLSRR